MGKKSFFVSLPRFCFQQQNIITNLNLFLLWIKPTMKEQRFVTSALPSGNSKKKHLKHNLIKQFGW